MEGAQLAYKRYPSQPPSMFIQSRLANTYNLSKDRDLDCNEVGTTTVTPMKWTRGNNVLIYRTQEQKPTVRCNYTGRVTQHQCD